METMMIKNTVSYYNNAEDSRSKRYISLDYVLLEMVAKDEQLKQLTEFVRNQLDEDMFKEEKKKLPMIAPSGIFTYRNDNIDNLRGYSNIMVLDFDKFPNHEAANEFKQKLIQYADQLHIYADFIFMLYGFLQAIRELRLLCSMTILTRNTITTYSCRSGSSYIPTLNNLTRDAGTLAVHVS